MFPKSARSTLAPDLIEEIWAPFRAELARDYVGLWEIVARTRDLAPELDDDSVRELVLEVVDRALRTGEAEAGGFQGGIDKTFGAWSGPADAITERISREWAALGADPNIGEVVWLSSPSA
ncbi:MAG TPA: hypothetical protein VF257_15015 [Solirubrobacteraceae bacterium]